MWDHCRLHMHFCRYGYITDDIYRRPLSHQIYSLNLLVNLTKGWNHLTGTVIRTQHHDRLRHITSCSQRPWHALPQGSASDPSAAAGYLFAEFKGDVPHVFFLTAPASNSSTFQALNGGQATLIPTTGTGGARDPYIFRAEDKSKVRRCNFLLQIPMQEVKRLTRHCHQYIVLATDLDIGKTNWGAAQSTGSRSIYVWESSADGVSWSKERLVDLMPPTAGYVSLISPPTIRQCHQCDQY